MLSSPFYTRVPPVFFEQVASGGVLAGAGTATLNPVASFLKTREENLTANPPKRVPTLGQMSYAQLVSGLENSSLQLLGTVPTPPKIVLSSARSVAERYAEEAESRKDEKGRSASKQAFQQPWSEQAAKAVSPTPPAPAYGYVYTPSASSAVGSSLRSVSLSPLPSTGDPRAGISFSVLV